VVGAGPVASATVAALDRIGEDPLNAFTALDEGAVPRAAALDVSGDGGPLHGWSVGLKDLIDHAGRVTTCGSSFYRSSPTTSATVVDRLETAGGVIVGRTGLHEFAFGFSSENHWFGPVRNPWDPTTSPGGSSGGSGAAVAAGLVRLGIGTDTGGSVRVPAALTGTFGLKPTHGTVPLTGVFPLAASVDTVGPITRTVADLATAHRVLAGLDHSDPWSRVHIPVGLRADRPRIGVPTEWLSSAPLTADVRAAFHGALEALSDLGADVRELSAPTLEPWGALNDLMGAQVAGVHRHWMEDPAKEYGPEVTERLRLVLDVDGDRLVDAMRWQASLMGATQRAFESVDLIATPTVAANRKVIGEPMVEFERGEIAYRTALAWFTSMVNHMRTPAVALPLAEGTGLPHSLQLIAPWGGETRLLDYAARLEAAAVVGFRPPPG
jgi:aspartyl-tRNA(Asn)/glutamyl-tRNA(Gln) amidotransferase subunit A